MRILLVLALILPLMAGCLSGEPNPSGKTGPSLTLDDVVAPSPGSWGLESMVGGVAAVLKGATLPASVDLVVPDGATMVRAVADSGASSVSMAHGETGRRRCNNPTVDSFSDPVAFPKSCSSVTALDPAGTTWRANFGGTGTGDLRIEFLDTPLDGLVGMLDLSRIDPPTLPLKATETLFVPSFDGVELRIEVTVPEGEGPWPVIIESSPYHDDGVRREPASFAYFVEDWAKRGYAIVVADVRGFGDSGGCVEVWGPNEQADQKFLVEWAAAQPWSDGNVGFYGQSYVATTPVAAAVQHPEALKAIIAVAPVINAYEDWHYGGVPNGESTGSPAAYQVLTEGTVTQVTGGGPSAEDLRTDPQQLANNAVNGLCDPTLVVRANDPRSVYDSFYEERNFKLRAADVTAAVLYTQGFEDANVKSAMIPGWFNELQSPKLGLFGHWLHQHPPRLDSEALMVGWMEQYLKGKDLGFDRPPAAAIQVDRDTERWAEAWPPMNPDATTLWLDFLANDLNVVPGQGSGTLYLDQSMGASNTVTGAQGQPTLEFNAVLPREVSLAGSATLHIVGTLDGAVNGYLGAELYEGDSLLSYGQFNLAHRDGHDQYAPVTPMETVTVDLPFMPTERLLRAGTELRLVVRGVPAAEATDVGGLGGVRFTFQSGADGTQLILPGAPLQDYQPIALTARP
ncbi:MAG: CocE/NonD family hydrolase [Candidatus Thermoplasmatota archaeon]|jgi:predicted acyl esterase